LRDRAPETADPLDLAVRADAERLYGDNVAATASYAFIVKKHPDWSWKPYAALARLCGAVGAEEPPRWPYTAVPGSSEEIASPTALAERLHGEMLARFAGEPEAVIERASWLYANARSGEASRLLAGLDGEEAAIARLAYGSPDRAVPDSARLAAAYPLSPDAIDAALGAFARAGEWKRFSATLGEAEAAGLRLPLGWFWRAVMSALDGRPAEAAEALRDYGIEAAGYASAYDIGILELAAGEYDSAADAFAAAASMAGSPEETASAYVKAGDALAASGRKDDARAAYEAALGADPASRDARSRLYRIDAPH
jgi:tetratricopeptide (TPR) repeat protein